MLKQIILIIVLLLVILYLTDSFTYLEGFGSKILNLNVNSQSGGGCCDNNVVMPYYGPWYNNWYYPYYTRYPYFYNNYYY